MSPLQCVKEVQHFFKQDYSANLFVNIGFNITKGEIKSFVVEDENFSVLIINGEKFKGYIGNIELKYLLKSDVIPLTNVTPNNVKYFNEQVLLDLIMEIKMLLEFLTD